LKEDKGNGEEQAAPDRGDTEDKPDECASAGFIFNGLEVTIS